AAANAEVSQALASLSDDPDLRVRYQAAFSLGAANDAARAKALPALLRRDGADRWVRLAVLTSAAGEEGPILAALLADRHWLGTDEAKSIVPTLAAQAAQH